MFTCTRRVALLTVAFALAACAPSTPSPTAPRAESVERTAPAKPPAPGATEKPSGPSKATGPKRRLSVATGGTGGVYYVLGGGFAKLISAKVPNAEATAEVTSASVDNMKLIRDGKADLAFVLADTAYDAVEGQGSFKETGKILGRSLSVLYSNFTQVVTTDGSGINKVADLKGKRVSVGSPGSGTEIIAVRILEAAGVNPDSEIQKERLGVAESAGAMKDRKLDAFFWSGGLPTAAVLDLANTPGMKIKLLPSDDLIPKLTEKYGPLYFKLTIPSSAYSGLASDVPVAGVANLLVVNEKMDDDLAFDLTKALHENIPELATVHAEAKNIKLETATTGSSIPFHNGAIKYYKEKNVWKQ